MGAPVIPYGSILGGADNPNRIRATIFDLFAMVFAIVIIGLIIYVQGWSYPLTHEKYPQTHYELIVNPMYKKENMTLVIDMWSSTFSVHENIDVWIALLPDMNQRNLFREDPTFQRIDWENLNFTVSFEGSYCVDEHDRRVTCRFVLIHNDTAEAWFSEKEEMRYSVGGSHDITMYEEVFTEAEYQQGNFSKVGKDFIEITSITAINSLKQAEEAFNAAKYIVIIALITTLVGLLSLYHRVRERLLDRYGEYNFPKL